MKNKIVFIFAFYEVM